MNLFTLLHPNIPLVTLRIMGGIAIIIILAALAVVELSAGSKRAAAMRLSPVFIVGGALLVYVVLITQGSIH
jgi:hypothetical protein